MGTSAGDLILKQGLCKKVNLLHLAQMNFFQEMTLRSFLLLGSLGLQLLSSDIHPVVVPKFRTALLLSVYKDLNTLEV